ncbi:hypothetical protein EZV62_022549 [Acer yangbiense]|uniref:DUF4283 domain-containing protein n=1 Tax=Acer yangbiense TaxID=1000413 RepID=A0A5C7H8M7_9ROSI|nr:hypothetical protein EZV62_022549 [Acer yangbiense]
MGLDDIGGLCEMLATLELDRPEVLIKGEAHREGIKEVSHCLMRKVLVGKRINREAFKGVIEQLWSSTDTVEVEKMDDNLFVFYFPRKEVRGLVWARGPWHFDNHIIVLEKLEGPRDMASMEFKMVDFWVQIHQVPMLCMNSRITKILAKQIGIVVEIPADSKESWGKFLRVRVRIDISKPLKRCLKVRLEGFEKAIVALIHYERLLELCFAYGKIGHVMRDCCDEEAKKEALDGKTTRYGVWMKAAAPKGLKRGVSTGREREVGEGLITRGVENIDVGFADIVSQLSSEVSGSGMGIKEGRIVSKADIRNEIIEEMNQKVLAVAYEEMPMDRLEENDGCLGGNQCVEESEWVDRVREKHMVLSPRKVSFRKWRRAARKWHAPKGMLGVTSPIKRILEAHHIAKSKTRDKSLFPKGKKQQIRVLKKNSPKKRAEGVVKRKIILPVKEEGAVEKKLKLSPDDLLSKETAEHDVQLHRGEADKFRCLLGFEGVLQVDSEGKSGGFYGSSTQDNIAASWELLKWLRRVDNLPWVCGGDFNEILRSEEKHRGSDRQVLGMAIFRQAIDDYVKHLGYNNSDHRPIILNTRGSLKNPKKGSDFGFKCEPFWLTEEKCAEVVTSAWGDSEVSSLVDYLRRKLSSCARKLEAWSKEKFGSLGKLISLKSEELEALLVRARVPGVSQEITRVEGELDNMLSNEEIYWRQRSRSNWLAAVDRNSRYFHHKASARKKRNSIEMLEDDCGRKFTDEKGISDTLCNYFVDLFSSSSPSTEDFRLCQRWLL